VKLDQYPVIVIVWAMPGCDNCEEYAPRFRAIAAEFEGCVPAAVINCEDVDQGWLQHYGVHQVPSTMVVRRGRVTARRDEAVTDQQIRHIFGLAKLGLGCGF
jgi:thioredoxin-like negative regulator of GroEL